MIDRVHSWVVAVRSRWMTPKQLLGLISWTTAIVVSTLLGVAGLAQIIVWLLEPETIMALMLPMQQNLDRPYFSLADIVTIQQRALAAGLAYWVLAAAVVAVGPRPWLAVLADAAAGAARLRRISHPHLVLLLVMTSVATLLALLHVGQAIRSDEANSFLNYGTRSPLVALGFYASTSNHILHSLLMRLSVGLFGSAEWAVRLPAMLAAIASIPVLYLAAGRHVGWNAALLAAAAAAGSSYLVELATNARGYSLVNLCFLLILVLLPDMLRRRPAAWAGFVVLAGLGAWAVPTMIYPFAIAVIWLLVRGVVDPPEGSRLRWLGEVALGVVATGAFVLVLYSPALVVTGVGAGGTKGNDVVDVLRMVHQWGMATRVEGVVRQIRSAWEQWVYPVPSGWAWLPLLVVALGWGIALVRGGHDRALAIAAILGPASVVAATAVTAPPSWTLAFGFVLAMIFAAVAVAHALPSSRAVISAHSPLVAATAVLLVVSIGTIASSYPDDIPRYHGYPDAGDAAAFLDRQDLSDAWVVATPRRLRQPTNYYLYRLGRGEHTITRDMAAPPNPGRLFLLTLDNEAPLPAEQLATTRYSFRLTDTVQLPNSWILQYDAVIPSSAMHGP